MRTLVVSDLHLGLGRRDAVLEGPTARERLLAAVEECDRVVLLGDVVELLTRPKRSSMRAAEPLLRSLGGRLGRGRDVVLVPGNHDRALIDPWLRTRRGALRVDSEVPLGATPELARLAEWLSPARVRAHYPGVWLEDGVWATHGHYLDRHLLPESSHGLTRGLLWRPPGDAATPGDYERTRRPPFGRVPGASALRLPFRLARAAMMPVSPYRLLRPELAPVTAPLLNLQMRRASLPALARVVQRLEIDAHLVVFGHVHRLGPMEGEDASEWEDPNGRTKLLNCGSWVYEALLVHGASPPHPYWPGGAVVLGDGAPRAVGLLDDVGAAELRRAARRQGARRRTQAVA